GDAIGDVVDVLDLDTGPEALEPLVDLGFHFRDVEVADKDEELEVHSPTLAQRTEPAPAADAADGALLNARGLVKVGLTR
ncbi:MAG TPA: hypothetical protein VJ747_04350, partial [Stellaceae bacterium]|nr:hypothetical protein [Stellaceae bacterium]